MSILLSIRLLLSYCLSSLENVKTISELHKRLEIESSAKLGISESTLGIWVSAGRKIRLLVNAGKCYILVVDAHSYVLGRITLYPPLACP